MNIMNRITLKSLKKNKTRTIVTIIGVIISTAMITAVTTFASSIQNFFVNYTIARTGDWHGKVDISTTADYEEIIGHDEIQEFFLTKGGGYSPLTGSINEYKPYLYIMELDDNALDSLPINLIEGRLPENSNEVLISEHIYYNGGVEFQLGEKIDLEVGQRYIDDYILYQDSYYHHPEEGEAESFKTTGSRSFTVVGFYQRFPDEIEDFTAPGYTILTYLDDTSITAQEDVDMSIYIKFKNPKDTYDFEMVCYNNYQINYYTYNRSLLQYQGVSNISSYTIVLYSLAAIVISLIIVGSVSLIYNSFSISISERRKQFGILSSVGATRKQIMNSIFFEALFIAIIGIPIGIGSGIIGIGITLHQLRDNFQQLLNVYATADLTLSVSTISIIAAVILSLITILISAYIPARKTKKTSALDAVRQTSDIKLTSKNVKTSKLARKIFGIEGDLALKNLKRNKKRYRSTVFSLFISVLLFISASAFSMYLTDSVENVYQNANYDFEFYINKTEAELDKLYLETYENINNLDGVYDSSIIARTRSQTTFKKEQVSSDYYSALVKDGIITDDEDNVEVNVLIYCLDRDTFLNYINQLGLDKDKYLNPEEITGIVMDSQHYFDNSEERYRNIPLLKHSSDTVVSLYSYQDVIMPLDITIGEFADTVPIGVSEYNYGFEITVILDENTIIDSEIDTTILDEFQYTSMFFKAENPSDVSDDIVDIIDDAGLNSDFLSDISERMKEDRNIITIIRVFAYGFIILMSLIAVTNVFNTITTNIKLRRREFAMLKSVGITNRGFNKMINYESIFYGLKALLYGIPASILVTYLIYISISQGVDTTFYLPTNSILISILSVFLVVFISMMYSMRKIRKENILDALKNENI